MLAGSHSAPYSSEKDRYILHLNHALAMEAALVDHLEKRAAEARVPAVRQKRLDHRAQTVEHRDALRNLIVAMDGTPTATHASIQPPVAPGLVGKVMTALESEKEDKLLMQDLADYSVEHFEAALYRALILIARNLGYSDHAATFESIRRQELDMAEFITTQQPDSIQSAFPPLSRAA